MPTVANVDEVNPRNYKIVRKRCFVLSGMQTGRDECIRIGLYNGDNPIIVSPAYTTFEIIKTDIVKEEYFFMLFLSKEMDRYGWFISDSSIRANLEWERFCDIEIDLPPLPVQQKYVDVYNAMLAHQKAYESGLEDLNTVIAASIEEFKHTAPRRPVGQLPTPGTVTAQSPTFRALTLTKRLCRPWQTSAKPTSRSIKSFGRISLRQTLCTLCVMKKYRLGCITKMSRASFHRLTRYFA
jgi:hypothetical protein